MSSSNKSKSNLPTDFNCVENDQVGSPNLIDNVGDSNLLPDCDNPGKSGETSAVLGTSGNVPRKLLYLQCTAN